ncbi:MAG: tRNA guanosine(34) transglycosylase Tgt [Bacteroidetes bacterium]|nr:MAG: tRNA guanosine(34) transglycosylase Tgt [Bacteroidota bacterium]TAG86242.1 MAG: tRNA guanosine(34) transglycosylase Tgt [Bacteroidota bacterium]
MKLKFTLETTDKNSKARTGTIQTAHGEIKTPIFMPVGTLGTVKAVHTHELVHQIKAQIILGNTYHLYLRPTTDILQKAGGLHKFNGWEKPILTDSGGFQVYSLGTMRKITEEGVKFKSHLDGSSHFFTPENVMDTQRLIGADIIMAFDECPPAMSDYQYAKKSMEMTHRWLMRCVNRFDSTEPLYDYEQTLFPIVQGAVYKDLRQQSAEFVANLDREGCAIGGLAVGEPTEVMYEMVDFVCPFLPENKPRYLMGVGTPANILENIALGVDMFDCVMPTRNARHGILFTSEGIINIKNKKWETDFSVIDKNINNQVSDFYSKSYLRHLIHNKEMLGAMIASVHNLSFYLWLVGQAREQIIAGTFKSWKDKMVEVVSRRL